MSPFLALDDLDFSAYIREGDQVLWGQVTSEPVPLTRKLMEQRAAISPFSVFLGVSFSDTVQPHHADVVTIRAIGGGGTNRALSRADVLNVVPAHISSIPRLIDSGAIACDVALVQVTPSERPGFYEFAVASDYIVTAVAKARVVIGEVNLAAPRTNGPISIPAERFTCLVETSRPVLSAGSALIGPGERAIAEYIANYIEDEATLQVGIGAVPDAVMSLIRDRKNLGVHSGMIGDSIADLMEAGIVTNTAKPFDVGQSVTGTLIGTERLYRFADRNSAIAMHTVSHTHAPEVLARLPKLISINSALEIDLTGQVNAEVVGGHHIGVVGGQVDYIRGASASNGGRSIIALPATANGGNVSRITTRLSGPVTTARSDVDVVVTEFGAAELAGRDFGQRTKALIAIAHPNFREALERELREGHTGT